jgi:hypothetical protein
MIVKHQHRGSSESAGCLPSSSDLRDIRRHRSTRTAQYDAETGWLQDREGPSDRQAESRRTCLDVPSKVVRGGPPNEFLFPADAMDDTLSAQTCRRW